MQKYHLKNRPDREITANSEINDILHNGKFCVISMCRQDEPYIVTLSYGFDEARNALYMHCATQGMKLDFIKENPRICATVIDDGGYVAAECEHNYRTAVFRGEMYIVDTPEEKKHGMKVLLEHLEGDPGIVGQKLNKSEGFYAKMEVLRIDIKDIHAKAGK